MADLRDALAIVASLAVVGGVVLALIQLRALRRQQQEETVIRLYARFGEERFQRAYWRVRGWTFGSFEAFEAGALPEDRVAWYQVSIFYETMGLLYARRLASIELLDDMISSGVLLTWNQLAPIIGEFRARSGSPQIWEWFEALARAMDQRLSALGEPHPAFVEPGGAAGGHRAPTRDS